MSRAYDMWIHKQLEPTDVIITGNKRRHKEIKKQLVIQEPNKDNRTEAEITQAEDEFLKKHGV